MFTTSSFSIDKTQNPTVTTTGPSEKNEQHNYATRSTALQHLNHSSSTVDIRKFCPTIIGCCYWNDIPGCQYAKRKVDNNLKEHFTNVIFLSISHCLVNFVIAVLLCFYSFLCRVFSLFFYFFLKKKKNPIYSIGHIIIDYPYLALLQLSPLILLV